MFVISDLHLGVNRTAGTTARSQAALADWQFSELARLLEFCRGDLCVNGDLFDVFSVDNATLLRTFHAFSKWKRAYPNASLWFSAGNHDLSKDSAKVSSLELLATMLKAGCDGVELFKEGTYASPEEGIYVVPHVPNQDLFDSEIARVPSDAKFVLLHCNYDNNFAANSDNSLNLTEQQADKLPGFIVLGHEHQNRYALDERLIVVGNQIPTSIADCLGPRFKYLAKLDPILDGVAMEPWLDVPTVFERRDWRDLGAHSPAKFVRVEGDATAQEAAEVITAIAKFRAKSEAFVVTNAVSIEGTNIMAGVIESMQNAKSVDVLAAIFSILDERERAIVKGLMEQSN